MGSILTYFEPAHEVVGYNHGYWSWPSMAFFIILSLLTWAAFSLVKGNETIRRSPLTSFPYILIGVVLVFFATFRLVTHSTGGADAPTYITMFQHCNDASWQKWPWLLHMDIGFRYFSKLIRFFVGDYHIFFLIVYSFLVFVSIAFLNEFLTRRSVYIPCVLVIFLYWRGFSTIRSNTAIMLMMLGLIMLNRRKYALSIVFALSTLLVHKMAFLYVLFWPFYFLFKRRHGISVKTGIILVIAASLVGRIAQQYFLAFFEDMDLGGAYQSYARHSIGKSFFDNFWKIAFEQILLAIVMILHSQTFQLHIKIAGRRTRNVLQLLWAMCIFDFIMIPPCFIMGVWRGYEFFYLPRIAMWCEMLYLTNLRLDTSIRYVANGIYLVSFLAWMTFRFQHMWEDSNLMPYILEIFV